jgi:hypothetical protein
MDPSFGFVEDSDVSMWIRGNSMLAFPTIITLHTICMGLLARANAGIDVRILGMAPGADAPMRTSLAMWACSFAAGCSRGSSHLFFSDQPDALPAI